MDASILEILKNVGERLVNYGFNRLTTPRHTSSETRIQHLDRLIKSIPDGELTEKPNVPVATLEQKPGRLTTDETIEYQKKELVKELVLLAKHLQQGCKINGKACDCCTKHPIIIEGLAQETTGMTDDPVFGELVAWTRKIGPMTTEAASASGKYDDVYPNLAREARAFYKALMPAEFYTPIETEVENEEQLSVEEQPPVSS